MKKLDFFLIILVFILGIIPALNIFIPQWYSNIIDLLHFSSGFQAIDFVYLIMLFLIFYRAIKKKYVGLKDIGLSYPILFFLVWMLFEIFRNVGKYGLSAPGEFRFQYMILVLPVFIALNFSTEESRKKLFKFLIVITFFIPLIYIPVIGFMKGWYFGENDRFLGSETYLGMVYAITAILLSKKYGQLKSYYFFALIFALPFLFFFFVDSHRSVWLAAFVILVILFYLKEIKVSKMVLMIPVFILLGLIIADLMTDTGLNIGKYLATRATAFINPEADPTSNWRLLMWAGLLGKIYSAPIIGEGFGGYWNIVFPHGLIVNYSPHNFYLQTLAKTGIVGLTFYFIIILKLFRKLRNFLITIIKRLHNELPIVITGFCVIITMHIYYLVYSLEYYSLMYLGLAIAVILDKKSYSAEDAEI